MRNEKSTRLELVKVSSVCLTLIAGLAGTLFWWDSANYPIPWMPAPADPFGEQEGAVQWISNFQQSRQTARAERIRKRKFSAVEFERTSWDYTVVAYPGIPFDKRRPDAKGVISFFEDNKIKVEGDEFVEGVPNDSISEYSRTDLQTVKLYGEDGQEWFAWLLDFTWHGDISGTTYKHAPFESRFYWKKREAPSADQNTPN